jgi:hypothetical protein
MSLVNAIQARVVELESRLSQTSAELATTQAVEVRLQQRLAGSKTAAEVEQLYARLDAAEAAAAKLDGATAALSAKAEEAERKLQALVLQKQRHLADITNLRYMVFCVTAIVLALVLVCRPKISVRHRSPSELELVNTGLSKQQEKHASPSCAVLVMCTR